MLAPDTDGVLATKQTVDDPGGDELFLTHRELAPELGDGRAVGVVLGCEVNRK